MIYGISAAGLILISLNLLLKDRQRAALMTSLASILFFNFGQVWRSLSASLGIPGEVLAAVWIGLFILGSWWIIRSVPNAWKKLPLARLTRMLNNISALALVTCMWGFAAYGVKAASSWAALRSAETPAETQIADEAGQQAAAGPLSQGEPATALSPAGPVSTVTPYVPPDIYYIILDGYGRDDVLTELYQHDNRPFTNYLRESGFYVAEQSHSNYPQTALSLASSLNYAYVQEKIEIDPEAESRLPLTTLIQESAVQQFLKDQGYRTIAFSNGFPVTELQKADDFHSPNEGLTNFEITLLSGSLGAVEWSEDMLADYRGRVRWTADELDRVIVEPGPKFVFVHIILPHPPFVFYDTGHDPLTFSGGDGSHFDGTPGQYVAGYRGQLQYTNALARRMIESILENSSREPVILLQGDHGPGAYLDWESVDESCIKERFSILNAYYLPGSEETSLYPGISPVNSFRVVLDRYFDSNLGLIEDRSYYANWQKPYALTDVTGRLNDSCILADGLQ